MGGRNFLSSSFIFNEIFKIIGIFSYGRLYFCFDILIGYRETKKFNNFSNGTVRVI